MQGLAGSPKFRSRAFEAAIWGQPIVTFDAMRQAYFRDAGASYNDVRFFGPEESLFDKTWNLPDIERLSRRT
jgi:hypothetical protein